MPEPKQADLTADLSGPSVYILYLHPKIDNKENKVFSHSESSLNDIGVVWAQVSAAEWVVAGVAILLIALWTWECWTSKKMASSCFEEASLMNDLMRMNR